MKIQVLQAKSYFALEVSDTHTIQFLNKEQEKLAEKFLKQRLENKYKEYKRNVKIDKLDDIQKENIKKYFIGNKEFSDDLFEKIFFF